MPALLNETLNSTGRSSAVRIEGGAYFFLLRATNWNGATAEIEFSDNGETGWEPMEIETGTTGVTEDRAVSGPFLPDGFLSVNVTGASPTGLQVLIKSVE